MQTLPDHAYVCLTPFGAVVATFPEDIQGIALDGPDDAQAFTQHVIEQSTDIDGISLGMDCIGPTDLMDFCMADGFEVFPPWAPPEIGNTATNGGT